MSNIPATPQEKFEVLKANAAAKGREFNEVAVKASLGIEDVVSEPQTSEVVTEVVEVAKPKKVSRGKIGKKLEVSK